MHLQCVCVGFDSLAIHNAWQAVCCLCGTLDRRLSIHGKKGSWVQAPNNLRHRYLPAILIFSFKQSFLMMETHFRGRLINRSKKYPRVYWPEHPVAEKAGHCSIHRIVGYEKFGDAVFTMDVHHVDENKENWHQDNLELRDKTEHTRHHAWLGEHTRTPAVVVIRKCDTCSKDIPISRERRKLKKHVFCSQECCKKKWERITWPSNEELLEMLKVTSMLALSKKLGVSNTAIKKRLNRVVA